MSVLQKVVWLYHLSPFFTLDIYFENDWLSQVDQNSNVMQVSLFFTESPTNPFLRCVDIKLVSDLCHKNGALVCIDGTFATPLNQKALALGADLILHSATKFIGGHNDVSQFSFVKPVCWKDCSKLICCIINLNNKQLSTKQANFLYQVLAGCISGSEKLITQIRNLHHVLGGALNPVSDLNLLDLLDDDMFCSACLH